MIRAQRGDEEAFASLAMAAGTRVVILAEDFADTPAGIQAELDAIVDSMQIAP